jgi:hypothetical protein
MAKIISFPTADHRAQRILEEGIVGTLKRTGYSQDRCDWIFTEWKRRAELAGYVFASEGDWQTAIPNSVSRETEELVKAKVAEFYKAVPERVILGLAGQLLLAVSELCIARFGDGPMPGAQASDKQNAASAEIVELFRSGLSELAGPEQNGTKEKGDEGQ